MIFLKPARNPLFSGLAIPLFSLLVSSAAFADGVCAQKHGSQICVSQGNTIVIKKGPESFRACNVQSIAADGSMSCYYSDNYSTEAMNLNSVDVVTALNNLDGIQQSSTIISRDADHQYVSYSVSTIYNDGTFVLYNPSTYATNYISQDILMGRYVTPKSDMQLTIPTYHGPQTTSFQPSANIVLRISTGKYVGYSVSTIYSDDVVALYNPSDYSMSYIKKTDLAQKLVLTINSAGPFQQSNNAIIRDKDKVYKQYSVSTIYSDGIIALYDPSTYAMSYRSLAELTQDDVTNLNQLTVGIHTVNGAKDSVVNQGATVILKQSAGKYLGYSVSTIYSDQEVALYNPSDYSITYYSKSDLSSLLVETLPSLGVFKPGMSFAVPNAGTDSLARTDYSVSAIYSDGVLGLYSNSNYSMTYQAATDMPANLIQTVAAIAPLKQGSLYLIKDKSGKEESIMPTQFYADQVVRFVIFDSKQPDQSKTLLARVLDLSVLSTECDSSASSCYNWWYQASQSLSDSLPLNSLAYLLANLKVNVNINKSATQSFQEGFLLSSEQINGSKTSCTLSAAGPAALLAGDQYKISDVQIAGTNVHIKSAKADAELDMDCKFSSGALTFGDLRHALGGYFSIAPTQP